MTSTFTPKFFSLKTMSTAVLLALACGTAAADAGHDEEGFHGYLRAGVGNSNHGGTQSCFGLGQPTMSYRLGNECDSYTEFGYTKELAKAANGVSFVGTIWANAYKNSSDFGDAKLGLNKAYIEARNLPFLNGGTAWIGKRFYMRPDIHILDMQYINLNGTGAGIDRYPLGAGKASYAMFKDNDINEQTTNPVTGQVSVTDSPSATRHVFMYEGLPVNPGGALDIAASIIHGEGRDETRHNGWQLSVFHRQQVLGGANTLGVQYGVGPGIGPGSGGQMGSSGSTLMGSDFKRTRVFDEVVIQPTSDFSVALVALYQRDKNNLTGKTTWATLGGRPVYAINDNFKLQGELGVTTLKTENADTARLTKLTIAPTISLGRDFWSRPELRLFATYGKWNTEAVPYVNAFNNSGPVYGNDTSGFSYGFQVEAWW